MFTLMCRYISKFSYIPLKKIIIFFLIKYKKNRKNGEAFNVTITVFPIYDSFGAGEPPILTHFATVLSEIT
jgi:hypothetical protein